MANTFVWYELCTRDVDAAERFYGAVIGWTAAPFGADGGNAYRILSMGTAGIGGLMPLPDGMLRPFWLAYVGIADADAAAEQAQAAGATIHRTMQIPDVGRIVLLSDPQGVGYAMIQGDSDRRSEAFDPARPGHGAWHELHTTNAAAAFDYYAGQHGWTKGTTLPMGPMGDYQLFRANETDIGGMLNVSGDRPAAWLLYFGVPDIDAAAERIGAQGGTVLSGPHEVPGGGWIVQFADPQGAVAAVIGPRIAQAGV